MSQLDLSDIGLLARIVTLEEASDAGGEGLADAEGNIADLQAGLLYASLTAAAEAGDSRVVTLQVKDFTGANLAAAVRFHCQVFAADMSPAESTAFTLAETGTGSEISTTAKAGLLIQTSALGVASITVHDVAGASGVTVYLKVSPILAFGRDEYISLAFDGV